MPPVPSITTGTSCGWGAWWWRLSCASPASSSCSVGSASAGVKEAATALLRRRPTSSAPEPPARAEVSPNVPNPRRDAWKGCGERFILG